MFGVSGSTCRVCRTTEQIEAMSTAGDLYRRHKGHLEYVSLNAVIVHPHAYTGLRTQVSMALVDPKSRLDQLLVVTWTPHKIRCRQCNTDISWLSEQDVLGFRSFHRRHLDRLRIQALVETARGKIANQVFDVIGEDNTTHAEGDKLCPQSESGRAAVLHNTTLCCEAVSIGCFRCYDWQHLRGTDYSAIEDFIAQHQDHPSDFIRCHVIVSQLDEYLLAQTWMPALQIRRYCSQDSTFPIDTVIVRMKCSERGCDAAIAAPFQREEIVRFKHRHRTHLHRVGFEALVKGDRGRVFMCTFFECTSQPAHLGDFAFEIAKPVLVEQE